MESIIVISDLHISVNQNSDIDDFGLIDNEISDFIINKINNKKKIILLGDVFECWEPNIEDIPKTTRDWHNQMGKNIITNIQKKYPIFTSLINNDENIGYISGNHDSCCYDLKLFNNVNLYNVKNINGCSIYFAHGHQADIYNSDFSSIGKCITCCCCISERLIYKEIEKKADKLALTMGFDKGDELYEEYACKIADKYNYDVIIYGHTHRAYIKILKTSKGKEIIYINTGNFNSKNMDILEINSDNEKIEFILLEKKSIKEKEKLVSKIIYMNKKNIFYYQ